MEVAAGFGEGVAGGVGSGLVGDGVEFGFAQILVGQVGGVAAVGGVVGAVIGERGEGEVGLDVLERLFGGYLGAFADVVHAVS